MTVNVTGIYDGVSVELEWEGGLIQGHLPAVYAIVDVAADNLDRTLIMANGARIRGDLLAHPGGFAWCASRVLEDFQVLTPEVEYHPPEGALQ